MNTHRLLLILCLTLLPAAAVAENNSHAEPATGTVTVEPATGTVQAEPAHPAKSEHAGNLTVGVTIEHLAPEPPEPGRRIHPPVKFLDADGAPVSESGNELSFMKTCGQCHDTDYIAEHNFHVTAGMNEKYEPGAAPSGRAWDTGTGLFGRWSPLIYRTLTPEGWDKPDMGTADWIRTMAPRHPGGGPADPDVSDLSGRNAFTIDPETGEKVPWDWEMSGTVELDCALCHIKNPDNASRIESIKNGKFSAASTASLNGTGVVLKTHDGWLWNPEAFDKDGFVDQSLFKISEPDSNNCRVCHGNACRCSDPVVFENSLDNWGTETTGELFSPQQIFKSGMNIKGKEDMYGPWDVHAQRLLKCTSCHYSMNNPAFNEKETADSRPAYLKYDTRRIGTNDFLVRPDHNLAKGHTAQGTVARNLSGSMRDCADCHAPENAHEFLPYKELHFENLNCQTCHIPKINAPTRMATDWTLITADAQPVKQYRGVQGKVNDPKSLITGIEPPLLLHEETDGSIKLGPYNVIVSWFWVEGDPERPVRVTDLKKAFLNSDGSYKSELVSALDSDGDKKLSPEELRLDDDKKVAAAAALLSKEGVQNPRITGEIQPYTLTHGVATGDFALGDCTACHSYGSRVNSDVVLSAYTPGGVVPHLVGDSETLVQGRIAMDEKGALVLEPSIDPTMFYIHGTDRMRWMDFLGMAALAGVFFAVMIHGGLRIVSKKK